MSFQGLHGLITPMNALEQSSQIADTEIDEQSLCENQIGKQDKSQKNDHILDRKLSENFSASLNLKTTVLASAVDESAMSTVSSVWGDEREIGTAGTDNWEVPSTQILEQLSNMDSKGSLRSEVQLRLVLV